MKRVQLHLPEAVLLWVDTQAGGIESRAAYLRRAIVGLMKADLQRQAARAASQAPTQAAWQPLSSPAATTPAPVQPLAPPPIQPRHLTTSNAPWASL